jgi:uncharacterized protein involved in response to NO
MLFGFIVAAIAGFLLTAVPSWTGSKPLVGPRLVGLWALWILGRVAFGLGAVIPIKLLALIELAFLPALALAIAPALIRGRNRNIFVLFVLAALWLCDATFLCSMALSDVVLGSRVVQVGGDLILVLITIVGGRIVPVFTANALKQSGLVIQARNSAWIERIVIGTMIALVVLDANGSTDTGLIAAVAATSAVAHVLRLVRWNGHRVLRQPILWVLHLAYVWLPVGLGMRAVYEWTHADWASQWFHALAVGGAALMIVAVMTRASLGHTGRPLIAPPPVTLAYLMMATAALLRAFATPVLGHELAIWIAGTLWVCAFALLLLYYAPILTEPRADGRPG